MKIILFLLFLTCMFFVPYKLIFERYLDLSNQCNIFLFDNKKNYNTFYKNIYESSNNYIFFKHKNKDIKYSGKYYLECINER